MSVFHPTRPFDLAGLNGMLASDCSRWRDDGGTPGSTLG